MSSAVQAKSIQQPNKVPETLGQLVSMIFRETLRLLKRRIPLAVGVFLLGWIIHTYLLVGPNGGFWRAPNLLGDWLSARQNTIGGILLWILLPALIASNVQRARRIGSSKYFSSFGNGFTWVRESFAQLQDNGLPLLGLGAMLALAIVTLLRNNLLGLVLAGCMVSALASRAESFWLLVMRLGWNDYQKIQNKGSSPKKSFSMLMASVLTAGAALGFTLGFILPGVHQYGLYMFFGFLVLSGVILAWYLSRNKGQRPPAMLFLVFFLGLMVVTSAALPVFADDGGWAEAGGSFGDWVRSEGALGTISRGILPAIGFVGGWIIGGIAGGPIGSAVGGWAGSELGGAAAEAITDVSLEDFVRNPLIRHGIIEKLPGGPQALHLYDASDLALELIQNPEARQELKEAFDQGKEVVLHVAEGVAELVHLGAEIAGHVILAAQGIHPPVYMIILVDGKPLGVNLLPPDQQGPWASEQLQY